MRAAILIAALSLAGCAHGPAQTLSRYEGAWGYVSSDPAGNYWAEAFAEDGQCGGAKQMTIKVTTRGRHSRPDYYVQYDPRQPYAARVVHLENGKLIAKYMGYTDRFELQRDGSLIVTHGGSHVTFQRCPSSQSGS